MIGPKSIFRINLPGSGNRLVDIMSLRPNSLALILLGLLAE